MEKGGRDAPSRLAIGEWPEISVARLLGIDGFSMDSSFAESPEEQKANLRADSKPAEGSLSQGSP